jgi:hypothetical protein
MTLVLNGTTGVSAVDGSASTPAFQGNDSNTGMFFPAADTIAFTTNGTEDMRIDSAGNVGIGTSSPSSRLHVAGGSGSTIRNTASAGSSWFVGSNVDAYILHNESNTPMLFTTNGSERARIDANGNLLVGTTSFRGAGSGSITFFQWNTNTTNTGFEARARFATNGTDVGFISTTGTTTTYSTSSDYRLKEDIAPMTGALAKVAALKPVTYKWKSDGSDGQGFIAHELAEVEPGCVSGEKDAVDADGNPVYQGIDTSFLVATLTAALQEQQALIQSLTQRIAALEGAQA